MGDSGWEKTMVATTMLLLVLSGPVKALTYLLKHGLVGFTMGALWRYVMPDVFMNIGKFFSRQLANLKAGLFKRGISNTKIGSSSWCCRVCLDIFIPDEREHTCLGFTKLWILRLLVATIVFGVSYKAWDEFFIENAKMAGESYIVAA